MLQLSGAERSHFCWFVFCLLVVTSVGWLFRWLCYLIHDGVVTVVFRKVYTVGRYGDFW